ncbi:MAG: hypothetical protein FJ311_06290 [Rhodospirillales bacterium]|nr:hypothetical protein [Rhodospirillales bacterium]
MLSDLDIYHSAKLLIDHHGRDAPIRAAMRADELLAAGDMDGVSVWKRIVKAIDSLLADKLPNDTRPH